jgi:hypothetical protein
MKTLLLILSITLIFSGCSQEREAIGIDNYLENFNKKFVDHFPKNDSLSLISYEFSYPNKSIETNMGVWLRAVYKVENGFDFNQSVLKQNQWKFSSSDTSIIFLPNRTYKNRKIEKINSLSSSLGLDVIPVPSVSEIIKYNSSVKNDISENLVHYFVFEAQKGKYLDENLLITEGYMPTEWAHGYSKGLAFIEDLGVVVYWIEIW